jgi:dienelactone hydrolase
MGGRTAIRCAGDPSVVGVGALAPRIEPGEPSAQLRGRAVLIAHGDQDQLTGPRMSQEFAARAALAGAHVRFWPMPRDGHIMLRHAGRWNVLVRGFVADLAGARAPG